MAWANSCAEASLLLQPLRPQEAERAARAAADAWHDVLGDHAHATQFCSGVYGLQRDLEWFRATFPQQDPAVNQAADLRDTVFSAHGAGVCELENENIDGAISFFTKSAQLRTEGHAFDWLYLAWAHFKKEDTQTARQWLEKADRWMDEQSERDVELDELRRQVAQMLGV